MEAYYEWLNSLISTNKNDFSEWPQIIWNNPYNTAEYQNQRDSILRKFQKSILFKETKPFYKQISKGCEICGSGKWNCLFITNKCNAKCFYCPAQQQNDETPSAQGIDFENPEEYAHFIKYFDFQGMSISGGEPLLFFNRSVEFLRKVKQIAGSDIYTWLYTNGILADKEKMKILSEAGLTEIRFDIGATGLKLDKINFAKGVIPNITIEIPAIPDEKERIKLLLPEMIKAGVSNLNLHQLRLTKHNAKNIVNRGYTIINAEKPIVLESELAALEIMDFAKENSLDIGINYCSFFFKHRFQKAGYRRQIAEKIKIEGFQLSQNGYFRKLDEKTIKYKNVKVFDNKPQQGDSERIVIGEKNYYYISETIFDKEIASDAVFQEIKALITKEPKQIPEDPLLFKIWQLEYIESGLRDY
jgi:pyruvate formate-lyase activating enzyme-like uncharacterized protein